MSNYNGWTNQETWQVNAILTNSDERIYVQAKVYKQSKNRLMSLVRYFYKSNGIGSDTLDFSQVNWNEIQNSLTDEG